MCDPGATMSNLDGRLVCSKLATSGPVVPPSGDWYQQCSPFAYNNSILSAYCGLGSGNGTQELSFLNTSLCGSGGVFASMGELKWVIMMALPLGWFRVV